jgi:hypothetical protein
LVADGTQDVGRTGCIHISDRTRKGKRTDHRSKHENGAVMTVFGTDRFEAFAGESDELIDPAVESRLQLRGLARHL